MSQQVPVRRFNAAGLTAFGEYLDRGDGTEAPPTGLLLDDRHTEPLEFEFYVEPLASDSKFDLGLQIVTAAGPSNIPKLLEDPAVWPWLSLFFAEKTMPVKNGKRFIGHKQRHLIMNSAGWSAYDHGHRHLVRAAVQSVFYFREHARVLCARVSDNTKLEEQILSRKTLYPLAYMRNVVEALHRLYWDPAENRARKGSGSEGPGGVVHFVRSMAQLDVNFDVASLPADRLIQLLPGDFGKWAARAGVKILTPAA